MSEVKDLVDWVVDAVDHKPKRTGQFNRLDDIEESGSATVLIDRYDDDWSQLWSGSASVEFGRGHGLGCRDPAADNRRQTPRSAR